MTSQPLKRRRPLRALSVAALSFLALAASAATIDWVGTHTRAVAIDGRSAVDGGVMPESERIPVVVSLKLRDKSKLDVLTARLTSGKSSQVLTSQEFLDRHAPAAEQAQRVVDYLRSHGFRNVEVAPNRLLVTAEGTPGQIKNAFQAELHYVHVDGRRAFANVGDANVPSALAETVLSVSGLQSVHTLRTLNRVADPATKLTTLSSPGIVGIQPQLFASIYGASGLPSASTTTIGIIAEGNLTQTVVDLKAFASSAGYPVPQVKIVNAGVASPDASQINEWNLDSQVALATAGGTIKSMVFYVAPSLYPGDVTRAINQAVSDNVAKVVSVSLAGCESDSKSDGMNAAVDQILQVGIAQGQTFAFGSGDDGSSTCVNYPAASPYGIAVGGTTLTTNGGTWVAETAWSGSGGGASLTEAAPSWQAAAVQLVSPGRRGVPDLAFDADPYSGALILVNGSAQQFGGTSLAAPLFAGLFARIQAAHGNSLGFPGASLYLGTSGNTGWFHDVTSGSNGGYNATRGWDYVTGLGSLQVQNFSSAGIASIESVDGNYVSPFTPPAYDGHFSDIYYECDSQWACTLNPAGTNLTKALTVPGGSGFANGGIAHLHYGTSPSGKGSQWVLTQDAALTTAPANYGSYGTNGLNGFRSVDGGFISPQAVPAHVVGYDEFFFRCDSQWSCTLNLTGTNLENVHSTLSIPGGSGFSNGAVAYLYYGYSSNKQDFRWTLQPGSQSVAAAEKLGGYGSGGLNGYHSVDGGYISPLTAPAHVPGYDDLYYRCDSTWPCSINAAGTNAGVAVAVAKGTEVILRFGYSPTFADFRWLMPGY